MVGIFNKNRQLFAERHANTGKNGAFSCFSERNIACFAVDEVYTSNYVTKTNAIAARFGIGKKVSDFLTVNIVQLTVMLYFDYQIGYSAVGTNPKITSAVSCYIVLDRIFNDRLEYESGNSKFKNAVVNFLVDDETFTETFADYVEICINVPKFFTKRNLRAAVSVQCGIEHSGQRFYHGAYAVVTRKAGFPVDYFKSVIEEMRIYL